MSHLHDNLLLIEDNPADARLVREALIDTRFGSFQIDWVENLSDGLERLSKGGITAVLADLFLPDSQGIETLDKILLAAPRVPILVLSGAEDDDIASQTVHHGAQDYLPKHHLDGYTLSRAVRNMIDRKAAEDAFFAEKDRAQVTLNSIGDAVLSTDGSGNVAYLNAVAEKLTGCLQEEASGRPVGDVFQIIDGLTRQPAPNPMNMAVAQDKTVGLTANCILIRRDGHESAIEDSAAPIHDRDGRSTGAVIVFHDVSVARAMVLEMSHRAQHDVLTDLPNRLLFNDRLTQAISMAHRNHGRVAVLFLDLDGFKNINDSLGHSIGDQLLQSVGAQLSACVRKSDTVSRQGGDEFVILLSEVAQAADAAIIAAKVLTEVKGEHSINEHRLRVTASIGVSTYPDNGEDAETLIKNADIAMYHAKQSGRDSFKFFKQDMNLRAVERQSLEGQLRYAVERSELSLHYQPKVDLQTGVITSVEALVRWQHPELGLLLPGQFLTIAENSSQIIAIGHWVLREACRQTRAWLDVGLAAVPVAVNISSLEFQTDDFIKGIREALLNAYLDPEYLELELTETVLMRHAQSAAHALEELKSLGVHLAIDDFGTGYSSLSYLTRFPIDALKLDQSFVHDIMSNETNAIVARAVISMGRNLQLKVIAEGVETAEQLAFLQTQGCDEGQGYYFSRPVAADQFAKLLETGKARFTLQASASVPL